MKQKLTNLVTTIVLLWGLSAMTAHFLRLKTLKGLALATCASPYPKVFCTAETHDDGIPFETFSSTFTLSYDSTGTRQHLRLTPEIYGKISGPYNRRNVYGAALAYGPALPPDLRMKTLHYALIDPAPLPMELGLSPDACNFTVTITNKQQQWVLTPSDPSTTINQ